MTGDQPPPNADYEIVVTVVKRCRECGAEAKIGAVVEHSPTCSGSPNICDVVSPNGRSERP